MLKRSLRRYFPSDSKRWASTKTTRKPASHWKLFLSTFIIGGVTAYYIPIPSLIQYSLNNPLPNSGSEIPQYQTKLQNKLESLPEYRKLHNDPHYTKSSLINKEGGMVQEGLRKPGGIAIDPIIFYNKLNGNSITFVYLGSKLCGYPFIIHGGILATILDEVFTKTVELSNDNKKTWVNYLDLKYKFPTIANNFVIIETYLLDNKSNEARIKGKILNSERKLLVLGESVVKIKEDEKAKIGGWRVWPF